MTVIKNKTEHSIRILWDNGSIVDPDGVAHKITHSTVKVGDIGQPQAPTTIPKKSLINEDIIPADEVQYCSLLKKAMIWPMLHSGDTNEQLVQIQAITDMAARGEDVDKFPLVTEPLSEFGPKQIGKKITLLLPMEIEGVENEYSFVFEVLSVTEKPYEIKE